VIGLFAQSPVDSLIYVYQSRQDDSIRFEAANSISRELAFQNPDSARIFGEKAIALANKLGSSRLKAGAQLNTAVAHHVQGEFEKALNYYQQVYHHHLTAGDSTGISSVLNNMGAAYVAMGNYPKALDILNQSLAMKLALNQLDRSVTTLNNMGNIYFEQDKFEKALEYYQRSLSIALELSDPAGESRAYNNIGLTFLELKKADSALNYYLKSEQLVDPSAPCRKVHVLDGLAQAYLDLNQLAFAQEKAEELLAISKECQESEKETSALFALGKISLEKGQTSLAEQFLQKAFEKAQPSPYRQNLVNISFALYNFYKDQRQPAQSLKFLEVYTAENDSLRDTELTEELTRVEMQNLFDEELDSIAFEQRLSEAAFQREIDRKQLSQYFLIGGLVMLIILIAVLYSYYTAKAETNRLLESQNKQIQKSLEEREVLMREIHHRVKNNLQVVSSLLNVQSKYSEHEDAKSALIEGRDRVLTMAMIHQKLYRSDDLTAINLKEYVEEIAAAVFESHVLSDKKINLSVDVVQEELELDSIINIGLIVNELITNSLKHAFNNQAEGHIKVVIQREGNHLKLTVSDNGVNTQAAPSENSYGHRLIQSLARGLDAEMVTTFDQGTKTELIIPS
jgi:two-component sensor histidine kinase